MADVDTREALTGSAVEPGDDGLWLGDALRFFLDAKRAGGRSRRTTDDYRKKLELFQRWVATRHGAERGSEVFDAPYLYIGADEVEAYVVHLKQERGMADSSRKNHLAVLRSFFQTISRRLDVPDPTRRLDEARFHQKAPKRSYLTRHEAGILLSAIEKREPTAANDAEDGLPVSESRRRTLAPVLAARDHAAFSVMIYAGLRIEETTALVLGDLSFVRGEEEVRVADRLTKSGLCRVLDAVGEFICGVAYSGNVPQKPTLRRKFCPCAPSRSGLSPKRPPASLGPRSRRG
ncbi:MAG: site-specific integrase, partial [Rubrobacter sp.]